MRINEFSIRRYGPLPDTGRVSLGNFSLLFGKNEDGKTLTIDALVKLLLQRDRRLFEHIKRVDEEPEGYLVLGDDKGKEVKLPEKGDLTDITDLTPQECHNIFIIRNSNLSLALESDFYRNVVDRLTGLRTEEILAIRSQLQERGKLTRPDSTASVRDWAGEKLKTRTKSADRSIEDIDELGRKVKEEEFHRLEEELLKIREKASEISCKIETLEEARKREKYEEGNRAYQALISAQKELKELEVYTSDDADVWAGCERDIKSWTKDKESLESEVDTKKREFEQKAGELDEKRVAFQALNERKKRIDNEIKPEIKSYEMRAGELKLKEAKSRFYTIATITSAGLLSISILGVIANPSPLLYALLVIFLVSTGLFAILRFSLTKEKAWLAGVFERIRLAASRFELPGETVEEILSGIQKFEEEHSKRNEELEQATRRVSILENEITRLVETDLAGIERKIRQATEKIESVSLKVGLRTLREYRRKLELKLSHERSAETQLEVLKSHFGSRGEELEVNLAYWLDQIEALKEFENKAKDITYDEKTVSQLKADQEMLQSEEEELESKITDFYSQLREIEREVNEILQLEDDYLHCDTSVDMEAIRDKLLDFVTEVEKGKDNALIAISIFENLEREEEEKISSLFGKDSPISKHFREITGGIYQEVEFIVGDVKKVQVRLKDGSTLDVTHLSGGAYDQLYLSIRLALGEKLLKGNKGFFIMDDPFIKADKGRLQRQIDILRRVSELGWQIIYFSAKDEVKDVLKQDIESGKVSYIELQGIFA